MYKSCCAEKYFVILVLWIKDTWNETMSQHNFPSLWPIILKLFHAFFNRKEWNSFFLEHHSLYPKDFHEINFHLFEKYVAVLSWQELEEFSALLYRLNIGKTFFPILLKKIFTINASEKSRARFFWKLHKFWIKLKLEFG